MVSYADQKETSPSLGPWGLRAAKLSPLLGGPGRPSAVVPYAHQNEASPSLGAANCETVANFVAGRSSGLLPHADHNEASPSLGAANCETVATFVGSWGAQRNGVIRCPE